MTEPEVGQKIRVTRTGQLGEVIGVNDAGVVVLWPEGSDEPGSVLLWETWEKMLATEGIELVTGEQLDTIDMIDQVMSGETPDDAIEACLAGKILKALSE
jgi:hypothetical protein